MAQRKTEVSRRDFLKKSARLAWAPWWSPPFTAMPSPLPRTGLPSIRTLIGRYSGRRPGHILHQDIGISGNMFPQILRYKTSQSSSAPPAELTATSLTALPLKNSSDDAPCTMLVRATRTRNFTPIVSSYACCLGSATFQLFGANRQFSNALAGGGEDGVGNSRGERRHRRLSDSARGCFARSDVDLDDRHFVDPQHGIVVEVALLHAALVDGDGAIKRGAETVDDAALHLRYHLIRV